MARRPAITREELVACLDRGMTYAQIGERYGITASAVHWRVKKLGLTTPNKTSHKDAIPWKVRKEHYNGAVVRYLWVLSSVAQGKDIPEIDMPAAFNWASRLVEAGLDIDYDPNRGPSPFSTVGGFYTKPRPEKEEQWHILQVLNRAKRARFRRPL